MALLHLLRVPGLPGGLLLRGGLVWMVLRLGAAFMEVGIGSLLLGAAVCGFAATAVLLDAIRRRETLFLANLGIPWWPVAMTAATPGAVFEIFIRVVGVRG